MSLSFQDSHERLTRLLDAMTCRICMDNQIDTAFLPCAHVVACSTCAAKCDRCPVCRADIMQPQKIFLPGEFVKPVCQTVVDVLQTVLTSRKDDDHERVLFFYASYIEKRYKTHFTEEIVVHGLFYPRPVYVTVLFSSNYCFLQNPRIFFCLIFLL